MSSRTVSHAFFTGRARAASVLVTAVVGIGAAGLSPMIAKAAPSAAQAPAASFLSSQFATEADGVGDAFAALEVMPSELAELPMSDPAVQAWIEQNVPNPAAVPGQVTPQFNFFGCSVAVAHIAVETGIPFTELERIADEVGGFKEFGKIVYYFVRNGSFPANASEEVADPLIGLSGLGSLASAGL